MFKPMRTPFLAMLGWMALPSFVLAEIPAADVWPVPKSPAGVNRTEFPVPRNEWVDRVQRKLTETAGKHYDIVFDGDSITDYWQGAGRPVWDARYVPLNAVDFGIGGDRVEHLLWRLKEGQVAGIDPKLVVLLVGTNDISSETPEQIAAGVKDAVDTYLRLCPNAHLLLLGLFPRGATATDRARLTNAAVNVLISKFDDGKRITYLDIGAKFLDADGTIPKEVMADALHPTLRGYQIWADAMASEIEKIFPDAPRNNAVPPSVPKPAS